MTWFCNGLIPREVVSVDFSQSRLVQSRRGSDLGDWVLLNFNAWIDIETEPPTVAYIVKRSFAANGRAERDRP